MKTLCLLVALGALIAATYSQTTSTPPPTPADWFECPEPSGFFAHPYDCVKYFVCTNNLAWLLRCPPGPNGDLYFDAEKKECNFADQVTCLATPTLKSM
ncbi:major mite allergen Der p 23-like [Cloeon dipterum]|uniref:major mite allergen Der p 23-like n=1 Tax=Cloeon dipterum TaxID=197152 RepID=UPI00322051D2